MPLYTAHNPHGTGGPVFFLRLKKRQGRGVCLIGSISLPRALQRASLQKGLDIGLPISGRTPPAPRYPLLSRGINAVYTTWMESEHKEIETALADAGLTMLQAVRLALDLVEESGGMRHRGAVSMQRCRRVIQLGSEQWRAQRRSVSFASAVQDLLHAKAARRKRTLTEIRGVTTRLLHADPQLARRRVNTITPRMLGELLNTHLPTPRQREKARVILHGLFAHCMRQDWMQGRGNPAAALRFAVEPEKEIAPLEWRQIRRLLRTARRTEHRACMPALGLMLWAGIRPAEVERMQWGDIDLTERVVSVRPRHSKTGGRRHVQICPALAAWLAQAAPAALNPESRVCPPNWLRRWKRLRLAAGIVPWPQDVLRHTFASYHAKHYRNFPLLQMEMGHRSAELLRTRYLNMRGLTAAHAAAFWKKLPG